MKPLLVAWDFFGVINVIEPRALASTLQSFLDKGAEQIIVSHSPKSEIENYIEVHQLKPYYIAMYGAEWHMAESGLGKAPALRDYITRQGPFSRMYVIGDSLNDLADGRQVGMQAILFDPDHHYGNASADADEIVSDVSQVEAVVLGEPQHESS